MAPFGLDRALFLDIETYSEADLRKVGAHRYAKDPSTEIMTVQWAVGFTEPTVWQVGHNITREEAEDGLCQLLIDAPRIVIHNSMFERNVLREVWALHVPIGLTVDTMAVAQLHSLPASLDQLCKVLQLPASVAKIGKRGKQLINLFCKPAPSNHKADRYTRDNRPKEWAEFMDYAFHDITALQALVKRLPWWNYEMDRAIWELDQRINDRGFAVDMDLANAAVRVHERVKDELNAELVELTGGQIEAATQTAKLRNYLAAMEDVALPNMQADTLRRTLEGLHPGSAAAQIIRLRLSVAKTSPTKYAALQRVVCPDGRLRGGLSYCGAAATGRWSGRLFQVQNLERATVPNKALPDAITAIKRDVLDLTHENPMEYLGSAVRGVIVPSAGNKLVVADLSNIEGRGLAWLADEEWKLQAFRDFDAGVGPDLYKVSYGRAFNVDPASIADHSDERQQGKLMELALGYGGSVGAFVGMAAIYGTDLQAMASAVAHSVPAERWDQSAGMYDWALDKGFTQGLPKKVYIACDVLKNLWRESHPATTALWKQLDLAFRKAIANKGGTWYPAGKHLAVARKGSWIVVRLPSGRLLGYPGAKVIRGQGDRAAVRYWGTDSQTRRWKRQRGWHGVWVENATQALARDVLAHGMLKAERAGYKVVASVHDELLTDVPNSPELNVDGLARCMTDVPEWAAGLPLAADGFEADRYRKD